MASLRQKANQDGEATWVLCFRVGKAQFNRDVGQDEDLAMAAQRRVEAFLLELNRGRRKMPAGLTREQVGTWVLSDGQLTDAPMLPAETKPKLKTLSELLGEYGQSLDMRGWFKRHPGGRYTLCEQAGKQLLPRTVVYNYEKVLAGTKWEVCRGWHIFRHSMASILANEGVDQRVIDDLLGHQTEEMRKRYRHLFPAKTQQVLALAFD